jgi:hypothetical protein
MRSQESEMEIVSSTPKELLIKSNKLIELFLRLETFRGSADFRFSYCTVQSTVARYDVRQLDDSRIMRHTGPEEFNSRSSPK